MKRKVDQEETPLGVERALKRIRRGESCDGTCPDCTFLANTARTTQIPMNAALHVAVARYVQCPRGAVSYCEVFGASAPPPAAEAVDDESEAETVDTTMPRTPRPPGPLQTLWKPDVDLTPFLAETIEPTYESVWAMFQRWFGAFPIETFPNEGYMEFDDTDKQHAYITCGLRRGLRTGNKPSSCSSCGKLLFREFNAKKVASEKAYSKWGKYKGMSEQDILDSWTYTRERGTAKHACMEDMILLQHPRRHYYPTKDEEMKWLAPDDPNLKPGDPYLTSFETHPPAGFYKFWAEHPYLRPLRSELLLGDLELELVGSCDCLAVDIRDHTYWVLDWKNTGGVYMKAFNKGEMGLHPLTQHMEDCNGSHYIWQVNGYALLVENYGIKATKAMLVNYPATNDVTYDKHDVPLKYRYLFKHIFPWGNPLEPNLPTTLSEDDDSEF